MVPLNRFFFLLFPLLCQRALAAEQITSPSPPWNSLQSQVTSLTLVDENATAWSEQCLHIFEAEGFLASHLVNHSNYQLINQTSGLCADHLSCAFQQCAWPPPSDPEKAKKTLNLPAAVVHPHSVADVVAAVKFANDHDVPLSVKTSGHSYVGASTAKDSLLLHMSRYPKYAINFPEQSLQECTESDTKSQATHDDMCALARARGKRATLRVGGGEIWDEAYRTVHIWNTARESEGAMDRLYHIVGGGAGTVSAAGGWLTGGGLSGTTGMRMYGFGADQVLQIEMVLLNGMHVRFGPSMWRDAILPGQLYPRTATVSGLCNQNSSESDETLWDWQPCVFSQEFDIDFADLWHAVRGGGSGYGIILSVVYQLHDKPGNLQFVTQANFSPENSASLQQTCAANENCDEMTKAMRAIWIDFLIDFYFQPLAVNVTEEESNFCGAPAGVVSFDVFNPFASTFCYGGAGHAMVNAWKTKLMQHNDSLVEGFLLSSDQVTALADSLKVAFETTDYVQAVAAPQPDGARGVPAGRLFDNPSPATTPDYFDNYWNALFPKSMLLDKREIFIELFLLLADVGLGQTVYVLGGKTADADDGFSSIPRVQREASFLIPSSKDYNLTKWYQLLLFGDGEQGSAKNGDPFPGGSEYNHIGVKEVGPLRDDWTQPCPQWWPQEERIAKCFSLQEAVWGTEGLRRLEAVKARVDPKLKFDCVDCVGHLEENVDDGLLQDTRARQSSTKSAAFRGLSASFTGPAVILFATILLPWRIFL